MSRSSASKCLNFTFFSLLRQPPPLTCQRLYSTPCTTATSKYFTYNKRSYATATATRSSTVAPPRRVVPLPTKVTEMKLRCKVPDPLATKSLLITKLALLLYLGTEFDQNGAVKTTAGEFTKSDFCQHHSLLPRDLRTIDTYSVYQKPTILVRPEAILVNVAHLKALLKSDMVVLFDTYGSTDSYNQSIFIYDLQERLSSQKDALPFEFR